MGSLDHVHFIKHWRVPSSLHYPTPWGFWPWAPVWPPNTAGLLLSLSEVRPDDHLLGKVYIWEERRSLQMEALGNTSVLPRFHVCTKRGGVGLVTIRVTKRPVFSDSWWFWLTHNYQAVTPLPAPRFTRKDAHNGWCWPRASHSAIGPLWPAMWLSQGREWLERRQLCCRMERNF